MRVIFNDASVIQLFAAYTITASGRVFIIPRMDFFINLFCSEQSKEVPKDVRFSFLKARNNQCSILFSNHQRSSRRTNVMVGFSFEKF